MAVKPIGKYPKDPDAVLDYPINWAPYLAGGDTITDAVATAEAGLTVDSTEFTTTTTTAWLSGGTDGTKYLVTTHITTAEGREDDRTIEIDCKER